MLEKLIRGPRRSQVKGHVICTLIFTETGKERINMRDVLEIKLTRLDK